MSAIIQKTVKDIKFMVEMFSGASEVVAVSSKRRITSGSFEDKRKGKLDKEWTGVSSYEEAEALMQTGYQSAVEALKDIKPCIYGQGKRISFFNDIVGYAPIVPLAMMNIPNSMVNSRMTPMKAKVLNVYYDMTASCMTDSDDIIKAGQKLLGAIMELEVSGYRFNLYAIQSYASKNDADVMCVKIKDANMPIDLKRISFPLAHTAFFRVVGFDWYSRTPKGTFRFGYGHALAYDRDDDKLTDIFGELFNEKAVFISCVKIMENDKEHLKKVLTNSK